MGSGHANVESEFVDGSLIFSSGGVEIFRLDGTNNIAITPHSVRQVRLRATIAQVNAGVALLAAVPGYKYRLVAAAAIAVGGAVTTVTTVDILATQGASSVKLAAFAQASLTQSTVLQAGDSGGAVLADGASYVANDANTGLTADITGSDITVATHVDFLVLYVLDAA